MNKQDLLKLQTCVLRVNIDCDGCKQKVKKLLQKIEGVYSTKIDAATGKVTVIGNVDPTKLVKKLEKAGKHTEIWSFQKGSGNFQMGNSKVGQNKNNNSNNKAHNNGGKGQMGNFYKDPRAMAMAAPPKDHKSVKFNFPEEEFDVSDDESDDGYDDGSSGYDDDDDDDEHEFHHGNHMPNKMMGIPMMGKHHGAHGPDRTINIEAMNDNKQGGVRPNKKGGVMDAPIESKGKTGKAESKKGKKSGDSEKRSRENSKKGGKGKKDGKFSGGFLRFGKKSGGLFGLGKKGCKGGDVDNCAKKGKKGSGVKNENGPKKGEAKKDGPMEFNPLENGLHEHDVPKLKKAGNGNSGAGTGNGGAGTGNGGAGKGCGGGGGGGRKTGNANEHSNILAMGPTNGPPIPMGPMGNVDGHIGHMGNNPALRGLPGQAMMNGGYYQVVGPGNPYSQHYMAMMMMNQQRGNGNETYQPMMFSRPSPPANFPAMPPADNYAHFFSDENANSCSIM